MVYSEGKICEIIYYICLLRVLSNRNHQSYVQGILSELLIIYPGFPREIINFMMRFFLNLLILHPGFLWIYCYKIHNFVSRVSSLNTKFYNQGYLKFIIYTSRLFYRNYQQFFPRVSTVNFVKCPGFPLKNLMSRVSSSKFN